MDKNPNSSDSRRSDRAPADLSRKIGVVQKQEADSSTDNTVEPDSTTTEPPDNSGETETPDEVGSSGNMASSVSFPKQKVEKRKSTNGGPDALSKLRKVKLEGESVNVEPVRRRRDSSFVTSRNVPETEAGRDVQKEASGVVPQQGIMEGETWHTKVVYPRGHASIFNCQTTQHSCLVNAESSLQEFEPEAAPPCKNAQCPKCTPPLQDSVKGEETESERQLAVNTVRHNTMTTTTITTVQDNIRTMYEPYQRKFPSQDVEDTPEGAVMVLQRSEGEEGINVRNDYPEHCNITQVDSTLYHAQYSASSYDSVPIYVPCYSLQPEYASPQGAQAQTFLTESTIPDMFEYSLPENCVRQGIAEVCTDPQCRGPRYPVPQCTDFQCPVPQWAPVPQYYTGPQQPVPQYTSIANEVPYCTCSLCVVPPYSRSQCPLPYCTIPGCAGPQGQGTVPERTAPPQIIIPLQSSLAEEPTPSSDVLFIPTVFPASVFTEASRTAEPNDATEGGYNLPPPEVFEVVEQGLVVVEAAPAVLVPVATVAVPYFYGTEAFDEEN